MKRWNVTAKTVGTAWCVVDAETEEEAIELARDATWQQDDWDINTETDRGGYIEATEE